MDNTTVDQMPRSTVSDPQQFTTALDELKQTGCLALITGTVDETVRATCSRQLFGALSRPHKRVLIHPGAKAFRLSSYLPHGITTTTSDVLSIAGARLRGETITPSNSTDIEQTTSPIDCTIFSRRLASLLADTEPTADTFTPGELRLGILTTGELLDQYGQSVAQTLLTTVENQMRERCGFAHCHLPVSSENSIATTLAEHTAIHIHLREREGLPPEQCWHIRDADCSSGWIPLDIDL